MSCTILADSAACPVLHLHTGASNSIPSGRDRSSLLSLPDEIKLDIVSNVHRKRDLFHLSLTCRELEDLTYRSLYKHVDVEIPQSRYMTWNVGRLPIFRQHVLRTMQELVVRNGVLDLRDPVYNKKNRSDAGSVDAYVSDLVEQATENRLQSIAFLHQNRMSPRLLRALSSKHGGSLKSLQCLELDNNAPESFIPSGLQDFQCRSVGTGHAAASLLEKSKQTISTLLIGQEKSLIEQYYQNRHHFLDQVSPPDETLCACLDVSKFSNLRSLHLIGLDATLSLPGSVNSALSFCQLESLTVESCLGVSDFFDAVSSTFNYVRHSPLAPQDPPLVPRLTTFRFRHEAFSNTIKDTLLRFLTSFAGLQNLSLLLENASVVERPSAFISNHGRTLESLVIESRLQPREHLGLDTSRPLGVGGYTHQLWQESINDICTHCPNLVELGMGFPWEDEMVRLRKTKLPQLQHLKSIHLRNFPQSQVLSQLGDYAIQEYSRKFIEWCFPALVGGSRPSLETLAIGPTLYETRWKCSPQASGPTTDAAQAAQYRRYHNPPEFLRTHHFCLDWAKTRFGRWNAMITPVGEKYMEELRGERPLAGVFEQVWLR